MNIIKSITVTLFFAALISSSGYSKDSDKSNQELQYDMTGEFFRFSKGMLTRKINFESGKTVWAVTDNKSENEELFPEIKIEGKFFYTNFQKGLWLKIPKEGGMAFTSSDKGKTWKAWENVELLQGE